MTYAPVNESFDSEFNVKCIRFLRYYPACHCKACAGGNRDCTEFRSIKIKKFAKQLTYEP